MGNPERYAVRELLVELGIPPDQFPSSATLVDWWTFVSFSRSA